jgi:hypothetical protein
MSIFRDKYFLISLSAIIIFTLFWTMDDNIAEDNIKGVVFDIKESKNGFVFYLETSDGKCEKCFFKDRPENLKTYSVKGIYSEDESIFFIEKMILLEHHYNQ